jgi:hypothetical protein
LLRLQIVDLQQKLRFCVPCTAYGCAATFG